MCVCVYVCVMWKIYVTFYLSIYLLRDRLFPRLGYNEKFFSECENVDSDFISFTYTPRK